VVASEFRNLIAQRVDGICFGELKGKDFDADVGKRSESGGISSGGEYSEVALLEVEGECVADATGCAALMKVISVLKRVNLRRKENKNCISRSISNN